MFKKGCLILVIWLVFSYANGVGAYGIQFIKRPLPKVSLLSSIPYQIFVDPVNGLDTNPGSLAQPVQSISPKALSLLSSIKASLPGGLLNKDVQIVLRGGTYYIPSTIVLDGTYSGNNGKKVYIMAYPGETPVLSGGQLIGTVTPANANSQWRSNAIAQVQNGTWNFKRLRVGTTTAIRARYPAYDPNNPYTGGVLFVTYPPVSTSGNPLTVSLRTNGVLVAPVTLITRVASSNSATISSVAFYSGGTVTGNTLSGGTLLGTVTSPTLGATNCTSCYDYSWTNASVGNYYITAIATDSTGNTAVSNTAFIEVSNNTTQTVSFLNTYPLPNFNPTAWTNAQIFYNNNGGYPSVATAIGTNARQSYLILNSSFNINIGDWFYVENIPEALYVNLNPSDGLVPNAWYLDTSSGVLSYNVNNITSNQDVVGAKLLSIMQLSGRSTNNISNIVLDGLTFMDTDAPDYVVGGYADQMPTIDYALELDNANNVTVKNCTFANLGSYGIGLENSSHQNQIIGNTINNTGGGGIGIGYNSNQMTRPYGNVISFNNISNIARMYRRMAAGIMIMSGLGNYISNNDILDTSYSGILVIMDDGYRSYENSFEYNNIIDTVQETNDMGPFYMHIGGWYTVDTNSEFKYNFIQNTDGIYDPTSNTVPSLQSPANLTEAIYIDDNTSGVDVYGNVVVGASDHPLKARSSKDLTIENNIFYNSIASQFLEFDNGSNTLKNIVVSNNIFYRPTSMNDDGAIAFQLGTVTQANLETAIGNKSQADTIYACLQNNNPPYFDATGYVTVDLSTTANQQALQTLLQSSACGNSSRFPVVLAYLRSVCSLKTYFSDFNNNLYMGIDQSQPEWFTGLGLGLWSMWTDWGFDTQSMVDEDPMFANAAEGNFTLQTGSPAFSTNVGFQPIPFNLIGNTGYSTSYHPPAFSALPEQSVSLGNQLSFTVNPSSVDNDISSLTVLHAPQGSTFTANSTNTSGTFTWTPSMPGRYNIEFLVQDSHHLSDLMPVTVNVTGNAVNATTGNKGYYWPLNEGLYYDGYDNVSHEQNFNLIDAHLVNFAWNSTSGWTTGPLGPGDNALLFNTNNSDAVLIQNDNYNIIPYNNGAFSIAFNFMLDDQVVSTCGPNQNSICDEAFMTNESYLVNGFRIDLVNISPGQWDLQFFSTQSGGSLSLESYPNPPVSSSMKILADQWYQLVISYTGSSATMYLNGTAVATGTGVINSTINTLVLGGGIGGYASNFNGEIDGGLRIYNYALSSQDVTDMHTQYLNKMKLKTNYLKSNLGSSSSNNQIKVMIDGNGMVFANSPSNFKNIINCGVNPDATICKARVLPGSIISLIAATDNDSTFNGWAVDGNPSNNTCVGTTSPCTMMVNEPITIKAKFVPKNFLNNLSPPIVEDRVKCLKRDV